MAKTDDMNTLLRAAAAGLTAEEAEAKLAELREKRQQTTDMNALLRAAFRGVTNEEVRNAAE